MKPGQMLALRGAGPQGPSFRHWRIYITANNGDTYTALSEIEFRATIGGSDISSPSTASSQSSAYSDEPPPFNADRTLDGDAASAASAWISATSISPPHWISFDFLSPVAVAEIALWMQSHASGAARAPNTFKIQGSADASAWVDVKSLSSQTGWVANVPKVYSLL